MSTLVTVIQPAIDWPVRAAAETKLVISSTSPSSQSNSSLYSLITSFTQIQRVMLLGAVKRHQCPLDKVHGQVVPAVAVAATPSGGVLQRRDHVADPAAVHVSLDFLHGVSSAGFKGGEVSSDDSRARRFASARDSDHS